jgi:hypothetical protein
LQVKDISFLFLAKVSKVRTGGETIISGSKQNQLEFDMF